MKLAFTDPAHRAEMAAVHPNIATHDFRFGLLFSTAVWYCHACRHTWKRSDAPADIPACPAAAAKEG